MVLLTLIGCSSGNEVVVKRVGEVPPLEVKLPYTDYSTPTNAVNNWFNSMKNGDFEEWQNSLAKPSLKRYYEENITRPAFEEWSKYVRAYNIQIVKESNESEGKVQVETNPVMGNQRFVSVVKEGDEWKIDEY